MKHKKRVTLDLSKLTKDARKQVMQQINRDRKTMMLSARFTPQFMEAINEFQRRYNDNNAENLVSRNDTLIEIVKIACEHMGFDASKVVVPELPVPQDTEEKRKIEETDELEEENPKELEQQKPEESEEDEGKWFSWNCDDPFYVNQRRRRDEDEDLEDKGLCLKCFRERPEIFDACKQIPEEVRTKLLSKFHRDRTEDKKESHEATPEKVVNAIITEHREIEEQPIVEIAQTEKFECYMTEGKMVSDEDCENCEQPSIIKDVCKQKREKDKA